MILSASRERSTAAADRLRRSSYAAFPPILAIVLGTFIVFVAGFAAPATLHDAAHDARHAFALPCH
ncbi:MAG: CbtB domain-containing protein [Rhodospirillales bacterium]|jgi:cobalt transporter subunit CbtB|nr:CbtB domain-containing protein [Rhodospirillales bacterium]